MDILLLGLLLCAVVSARFTGKSFHTGYIDKEQTTDINGIFVALVFRRLTDLLDARLGMTAAHSREPAKTA